MDKYRLKRDRKKERKTVCNVLEIKDSAIGSSCYHVPVSNLLDSIENDRERKREREKSEELYIKYLFSSLKQAVEESDVNTKLHNRGTFLFR